MAAQMDESELRELVEYLKNSLSGHDRNKQKNAEQVRVDFDLDLCLQIGNLC
jgi:hypothetical protein